MLLVYICLNFSFLFFFFPFFLKQRPWAVFSHGQSSLIELRRLSCSISLTLALEEIPRIGCFTDGNIKVPRSESRRLSRAEMAVLVGYAPLQLWTINGKLGRVAGCGEQISFALNKESCNRSLSIHNIRIKSLYCVMSCYGVSLTAHMITTRTEKEVEQNKSY